MADATRDYRVTSIRAAAVLTTSYVVGTRLTNDIWRYNQLIVLVQLTLGSLSSAEVRVEASLDDSTWFKLPLTFPQTQTQLIVNPGEYTMTSSDNYAIAIPIAYNFIRISAKGTGTVTDSTMTIDAILAKI